MWDLDQDASAITRDRIRAHRAAMLEVLQDRQRIHDDLMAGARLEIDDEAHAARIVLTLGIEQTTGLRVRVVIAHVRAFGHLRSRVGGPFSGPHSAPIGSGSLASFGTLAGLGLRAPSAAGACRRRQAQRPAGFRASRASSVGRARTPELATERTRAVSFRRMVQTDATATSYPSIEPMSPA